MGYRDDQKALRLRTERLEEELAEARHELEELRGQGQAEPAAEITGIPPRSSGRSSGPAVGLVLALAGVILAVVAPLPPVLAASACLIVLGGLLAASGLLRVVRPNEALVLAGRRHQLPDGSVSNFTLHLAGRVLRRPLIETASTLDLRVIPVEVVVHKAYCRTGTPLDLTASAVIKVSSKPNLLRNAAERFLDAHASQLVLAAQQTLEGTLREAVAGLSVDELDGDRMMASERIGSAAQDDLDKLGISLVGFWLRSITDPEGEVEQQRNAELDKTLRAAGIPREAAP